MNLKLWLQQVFGKVQEPVRFLEGNLNQLTAQFNTESEEKLGPSTASAHKQALAKGDNLGG